LRHLFDWLVTGQVMPVNPAYSVRGPSHTVKEGKTPVLAAEEARALLDSIEVTTIVGLRDRALIGIMVFSFARIGGVLGMKVEDVYTQNCWLWVQLREKGSKAHAMPCHHKLETYLSAYIDGAGLTGDPKGPLGPTIGRSKGRPLIRPKLTWQCQFDVAQAEAEHVVQPHSMADDLRGEAVAVVRVGWWFHTVTVARVRSRCQTRLPCQCLRWY
jgi:site-specific recombinase XerC